MIDRTKPLTEQPAGELRVLLDGLRANRERYDREDRIVEVRSCDLEIAEATRALAILNRRATEAEAQRASEVERTVWAVTAQVTGYKLEADGDYHIVIADADGHHMIIEIPDPACAAGGAWGPQIREARAAFLAMLASRGFPPPRKGKLHPASFPVRASGPGFFDRIHGQDGVARPSGIELHPVLSIAEGK